MSVNRPEVLPMDDGISANCLCGDPATFVVDMIWFSGRHSRDPVCELHVMAVIEAISREQARRNGA
jgi:hypothetical protein